MKITEAIAREGARLVLGDQPKAIEEQIARMRADGLIEDAPAPVATSTTEERRADHHEKIRERIRLAESRGLHTHALHVDLWDYMPARAA
jgi:hypothetical protein